MDFKLSEMHEDIRKLTSEIVEKELKPVVAKLDRPYDFAFDFIKDLEKLTKEHLVQRNRQHRKFIENLKTTIKAKLADEDNYPSDFMNKLGKLGFMGMWLPEEYGGLGQGILSIILTTEEIARICVGTSAAYADSGLGALPILLCGTEKQKQKYLTKIAVGTCLTSFALTEAGSGSDAFNMKTKAVHDGDNYVLNGEKQFITNAGKADICVVFTMTNPAKGPRGISGFILEKGMDGFSVGPNLRKMGLHCSDTRNVILENCRVPKDNLLGGVEGLGAIAIMNTLYRSRPIVGAQGVGCAKGAYELAWNYASQTERFGQKILSFQAIKHMFAEMALDIENAKNLVYKTAWLIDQGIESKAARSEIAKLGSMAKLFASEAAISVASRAITICGGSGYMEDFKLAKYYRDAMALRLYEGTNPIQFNEIAQILIKESAK